MHDLGGVRLDREDLAQHASRAPIEARVTLDEVLTRFPVWEVDLENAALAPTSTVRGWETLPATVSSAS